MATSSASAWATANALSIIMQDHMIEFAAKFPVIANLVRVVDITEGVATRIRRWPTISAGAVTEGTDITTTTVTPTATAMTASQVGLAMELTDLLMDSAGLQLGEFARQGLLALIEKMEDDLAALFGALAGGTSIGTSGSDLTFANCLDALVTLKAAQVPPDMAWVLHPQQFRDYFASVGAAAVGGSFVGQDVNKVDNWGAGSVGVGFVTRIAGIPAYESARCPLVNTSADRGGALFQRDAISVARKWKVKVEQQRNALGVATQLVVTSAYSAAETADNFGVPVETDA